MQNFKNYIKESFKNYVKGGLNGELRTPELASEIKAVLDNSYKDIGGLIGSGFKGPQDMIDNLQMWKIDRHPDTGKIAAVIVYKDKDGRKSVAIGSDGSERGKNKVKEIFGAELSRSYGEKSKGSLGLASKILGDDLKRYTISPEKAKQILKKEVQPIKDIPQDQWPEDAKLSLGRIPWLIDFGYLRDIGGKPTFKVMMGTPGKSIV